MIHLKQTAKISQSAGGIGLSITQHVRATGSYISRNQRYFKRDCTDAKSI